jgi:cytochrome c biogenesis protein CcmG, thiol:disulfide interchange protein DsbE
MRTLRSFSLVLPLMLLGLLSACNRNSSLGLVGGKAPDFTVQDADRKVALHDYKGKPVLLNFWATYCGPCVEEMPSLMQFQKQMGSKITVVAVSEDGDAEKYHAFLKQYKIDFLTVRDATAESKNLYQTTGIPETFVIDSNGVIRRKFIGAVDWTRPDLIDYFNKL